MSTTTIRLPDALKARISLVAERSGSSAHSFILEAIVEKAEREERGNDFRETAERRYAAILASGETIAWSEMRKYLEQRAEGGPAIRPTSSKLQG